MRQTNEWMKLLLNHFFNKSISRNFSIKNYLQSIFNLTNFPWNQRKIKLLYNHSINMRIFPSNQMQIKLHHSISRIFPSNQMQMKVTGFILTKFSLKSDASQVAVYSHSQWLFYEFISNFTNKLVKQSLRVTVCT